MGIMHELMQPAFVWFFIGLILLFAELIAPGLVIIFFGLAAWVVAGICLVKPISVNTQLVIFILLTPVILFALRSKFKSIFSGHTSAVQNPNKDIDDFVGKRAVVKETIFPNKSGKVELNGTLWTADALEEIAPGENVQIVSRENLLLKVKKG